MPRYDPTKSDQYDFPELAERALRFNATQEDINALAEWLDRYDRRSWNGERYKIDADHDLYPIYEEVAPDEWEIIGYEIR